MHVACDCVCVDVGLSVGVFVCIGRSFVACFCAMRRTNRKVSAYVLQQQLASATMQRERGTQARAHTHTHNTIRRLSASASLIALVGRVRAQRRDDDDTAIYVRVQK